MMKIFRTLAGTNCEKASRYTYENEFSLCKECLNVEFEEIKPDFKERQKNAET